MLYTINGKYYVNVSPSIYVEVVVSKDGSVQATGNKIELNNPNVEQITISEIVKKINEKQISIQEEKNIKFQKHNRRKKIKVGDNMVNNTQDKYALLSTLKIVLKARDFDEFDDAYLKYEMDRAIDEINRCRRFTPTDDNNYDKKYEYLIIPFCISAIAKIGAEGQISHTENGISRSYGTSMDYPKELVQQIIPLIK